MTLPVYLAMTSLELEHCFSLPSDICWMACQFSSYNRGITNIPEKLPEHSLIMINDQFPPNGHDPEMITKQLMQLVQSLRPKGIILDMQRPHCDSIQKLTENLQAALPCPVAATPSYASDPGHPIFVPPIPPNFSAEKYLTQWQGREIWLELDSCGLSIELTKHGSKMTPGCEILDGPVFTDSTVHCHYRTCILNEKVLFTLSRTPKDTQALLLEAKEYGVRLAVGLYQEMKRRFYLSTD